jgi:hypothetical protein
MSLQKSLHCKSETSITLIQNRNFTTDDYIIYFKPIYDNILRKSLVLGIGLVYGVKRHLQQYFSYIVVVSSIVGGKRRKPPTCRKSLTLYHIILYRVHLALSRFELTMLGEISTHCTGSCKSNHHMITTITSPVLLVHLDQRSRWTIAITWRPSSVVCRL